MNNIIILNSNNRHLETILNSLLIINKPIGVLDAYTAKDLYYYTDLYVEYWKTNKNPKVKYIIFICEAVYSEQKIKDLLIRKIKVTHLK
jgi:hypothetical protein